MSQTGQGNTATLSRGLYPVTNDRGEVNGWLSWGRKQTESRRQASRPLARTGLIRIEDRPSSVYNRNAVAGGDSSGKPGDSRFRRRAEHCVGRGVLVVH